jgi:hypothetical protein
MLYEKGAQNKKTGRRFALFGRWKINMKAIIQKLMENAIDFHLHVAPDPAKERSVDAWEAALQAKNAGMKGIVLKGIHYPTAPLAYLTRKVVEGLEIIGSLTLNQAVGGFNPDAVEASAKMGAKVVWMPTVSSKASRRLKGFSDGLSILDRAGEIRAEVEEILSLVGKHGLILATGHLPQQEILALFEEAKKYRIGKFVLTHPLKVAGEAVDIDVQRDLAERGAYIEHCFGATLGLTGRLDPQHIYEAIRYVGAEKCILSTDLGNFYKPLPAEGMRMALATLYECGLSEGELELLVKVNPARLLEI